MDRFEALDTFTRVVEFGSFTAAADSLDVAKSAVSRRIGELEAHLGVQLFHRTTRKLNLTQSGRSFHDHAKRILEDLAEAESRVSQEHQELRGRLRIAVPMSFGMRHLSPVICEFGGAHPKIEFDVDFNDRRVDLLQEGFDLAVRIGQLEDSSLIARRLFDARTVICAGPGYLAEHGTPRTPDELVDHKGLVYSNVPVPDRWVWRDNAGMKHSVRIPVALSANSGEYLCEAAVANRGIALQPTFIAHHHIARGELIPILTDFGWPITPAYAIYPPTRHLSYRVRAFIDHLADRFAGTPYWDEEVQRKLKA
jgi:DNA-binding transcriptional LysR family regulator